MSDTVVVNLFGEPSTGKSTAAAYIFSMLKMKGISCEYISEVAKDKVWDEEFKAFEFQSYLFGNQQHRLGRVNGKVDIIVTDSPLLLSAVYNSDPILIANPELHEKFKDVAVGFFKAYNNINFLLQRQHAYENLGRNESEAEARKVRETLCKTFERYNVDYEVCPSKIEYYNDIVEKAIEYSNELKAARAVDELCMQLGFEPVDINELKMDALIAIREGSKFPFKYNYEVDGNVRSVEYMAQKVTHDEDTGKYKVQFVVADNEGNEHFYVKEGIENRSSSFGKDIADWVEYDGKPFDEPKKAFDSKLPPPPGDED